MPCCSQILLLVEKLPQAVPIQEALSAFELHLQPWTLEACTEDEPFPGPAQSPPLIWNRLPARPQQGSEILFQKGIECLRSLEKQGIPLLNGLPCHLMGTSKWSQVQLLQEVGLSFPKTSRIQSAKALEKITWSSPQLLKPDAGGFGTDILSLSPEDPSPPPPLLTKILQPSGQAVLQERIVPAEPFVYRLETLGGELLYAMRTPLKENTFNYCLGNEENLQEWVDLSTLPDDLPSKVKLLCQRTQMDLGSLEFIKRESDHRPVFFDINPVSTFSPEAESHLGFSPWQRVASFIKSRTARKESGLKKTRY